MTSPESASPFPNEDGVRYERVDDLTVNVYIEGGGDRTVRPSHPAVRKIIERDRAQIDELIARVRREQDQLNARRRQKPKPD